MRINQSLKKTPLFKDSAKVLLMSTVIYLHGLASSPQSAKAQYFGARFRANGFTFLPLDLNQPDFFSFSLTRAIEQTTVAFRECCARDPQSPIVLMGSSFGALTALHTATQLDYPSPLCALVLLAPAFDFMRNKEMRPEDLARWKADGQAVVCPNGSPLSFNFITDVERYNSYTVTSPKVPTLVIHGRADQTIGFEQSEQFAQKYSQTKLAIVESNHELLSCFESLWASSNNQGIIPEFLREQGALTALLPASS